MAMIDLNRVLNQSLSSLRFTAGPKALGSGRSLNVRGALLGLLAFVLLVCPLTTSAQQLNECYSHRAVRRVGQLCSDQLACRHVYGGRFLHRI